MKKKVIPKFRSENAEREFWATQEATEFIDFSQAKQVFFPNLRPSTKVISIRLPESLLESIKVLANKKDVPYQSLMKILLSEAVDQELKKSF